MLLAAARPRSPVREATPNEVKVAVTGYGERRQGAGRADGRGRASGSTEAPRPDDAADALAIAIWAANAERPGAADRRGRRARPGVGLADGQRRDAATSARPRGARAEKRPARAKAPARPKRVIPPDDRLARWHRRSGRVRLADRRGRRGRVPRVRVAVGARLGRARAAGSSCSRTTSCARTCRRCTASGRPRSSGSSGCC